MTARRITVEEYAALDEPEGMRYELSRGELLVTPSPTPRHNLIRDNLARALHRPDIERLGEAFSSTDVILGGDVVRRPDVAFIRAKRFAGVDLDQVLLPVVPDLVIEIVSRSDRADDLLIKVLQYLEAGAQYAWLMYPSIGQAYRYTPAMPGPQVRTVAGGDVFDEPALFPGFSLPLSQIFGCD